LTIIPDAYGDEKGWLRANLIKGLAAFIKERPDTNRDTMIAALQEIEVDQLERDARSYCAVEGEACAPLSSGCSNESTTRSSDLALPKPPPTKS
jgi:hypothetical protein